MTSAPSSSPASPTLAAFLSSGGLERLYTGLSVLVSAAADGRRTRVLASFGALAALLDDDLEARCREPSALTALSPDGRERFIRSLLELRATALELDGLEIRACAAGVEALGLDPDDVRRRLDGISSTPRFLREVGSAELLFV